MAFFTRMSSFTLVALLMLRGNLVQAGDQQQQQPSQWQSQSQSSSQWQSSSGWQTVTLSKTSSIPPKPTHSASYGQDGNDKDKDKYGAQGMNDGGDSYNKLGDNKQQPPPPPPPGNGPPPSAGKGYPPPPGNGPPPNGPPGHPDDKQKGQYPQKDPVLWGQCGGYYYHGPTKCPEGSYCHYFSDWYSQCNTNDHH